jgi:hypothetical protein
MSPMPVLKVAYTGFFWSMVCAAIVIEVQVISTPTIQKIFAILASLIVVLTRSRMTVAPQR